MKTPQNHQFLKLKNLSSSIRSVKKILTDFADKNGIYENFGQQQVSQLKDKFINISDYSKPMNVKRDEIQNLSDWCANYTQGQ